MGIQQAPPPPAISIERRGAKRDSRPKGRKWDAQKASRASMRPNREICLLEPVIVTAPASNNQASGMKVVSDESRCGTIFAQCSQTCHALPYCFPTTLD